MEIFCLFQENRKEKGASWVSKTGKSKHRFPEFTDADAWEQRRLGEVAERVTRKNKELLSTLPLTISAQDGLIDQNEFFNKTVASRDVSGYYLVKNGEFAYNKSYSNGYPWGAVKRLDRYDMGVLSTLYIVFKPTDVNSDFLATYYDTTRWYSEVSRHAAEGARNHGLLNIAATDFFKTELLLPKDEKEQQQIADFFQTLDATIASHQRKHSQRRV
ncbi:Type I restriction-modification system, specificity subunit S [Streptococcus sp. DD11]|uniref:restriction endonuclease subunit S n=1 Tax=Streptococcus sp. DD11 TaxID=1777879 RepID=UPI000793FF96|nr:restriction endonuclease subunit S [Streptococcus sp. DD11]KXT79398.1 Type I restriction-modification system, specificity subunit S [Streptococcus sp. DD11]